MSKRNIVIIMVILIVGIVIAGLYGTFAANSTANGSDGTYAITLTGSTEEVVVPANSSKTVMYQITNTNKGMVNYAVVYSGTDIEVRLVCDSQDKESDLVDYGETRFVKLYIANSGSSESTATLKTILGYENGGELDNLVPSGYTVVDTYYGEVASCINTFYSDAEKTTAISNDITYNVASSALLMNDRLGGTTSDYDAGNIRYYGQSPKNYIDIGDRDSEGNVVLWRIIGLFKNVELADARTKNLVKIIRNDSIGDLLRNSEGDSCNWETSTLSTYLNEGDYYTSLSSTVTDKIQEVVWPLGGISYSSDNVTYQEERGTNVYSGLPTEWIGEITIMYGSDYLYARSMGTVIANWMHFGGYAIGPDQCTLAPYVSSGTEVVGIHGGKPNGFYGYSARWNYLTTRPVFYLTTDTVINGGYGDSDNPYIIEQIK